MQTPINLWLWKYIDTRSKYDGYHLRADEAACRTLMARLDHPDFSKASFELRTVPKDMPLILAPDSVKFRDFQRLRLRIDLKSPIDIAFEETGEYLDLFLNDTGRLEFLENITQMSKGEWDYSGIGNVWYWGVLSEADYQRHYGMH